MTDIATDPVPDILAVHSLSKVYAGGLKALDDISLTIKSGEIFALLGPNGAGKTTLIGTICGIINATSGTVNVGGFDIVKSFRAARSLIGLVPQELTTDAFETVWNTVSFSRGLFGKAKNPDFIESTLKSLSLWEKKDSKLMTLSGGMKRRLMIAKALSHEPRLLFLDEPTAGVDVTLRKSMWDLVRQLRDDGVTIILTTHYIEEAEDMADRVGVINKGRLIVTDDKASLMQKMGRKQLFIDLREPLGAIPVLLETFKLSLEDEGRRLAYTYNTQEESTGIDAVIEALRQSGIVIRDLHTSQSSLEDIFVDLVKS